MAGQQGAGLLAVFAATAREAQGCQCHYRQPARKTHQTLICLIETHPEHAAMLLKTCRADGGHVNTACQGLEHAP